jgi:hypothetical protein
MESEASIRGGRLLKNPFGVIASEAKQSRRPMIKWIEIAILRQARDRQRLPHDDISGLFPRNDGEMVFSISAETTLI